MAICEQFFRSGPVKAAVTFSVTPKEPTVKYISGKKCRYIGNELERVYTFLAAGSGETQEEFRIVAPHWLYVKAPGYHVIVDRVGYVHHIFDFLCFRFVQKNGAPEFDF